MYLKRLELSGFKSFAGQTAFVFDLGFTAVVGPNGSGKSNVTDALRWVFGEQRQSLLRGKKADDVIFAGSSKRGRSGSAEVTAVFDNSDRKMPLDAPEVAITRRVDRSGASEYFINGGSVRLQDLADLVLQSGIGTGRSAVIGQGAVDQLISGGPGELKALVDEVSGVKVYYVRRDKAEKRLEQTDANLLRAEDRLGELLPRLKLLQRQVEKFQKRNELEHQLSECRQRWFFFRWKNIFEKVRKDQNDLSLLEVKVGDAVESLEKAKQRKNQLLMQESETASVWKDLRGLETQLAYEEAELLKKQAILEGSQLSGEGADFSYTTEEQFRLKSKLTETLQRLESLNDRLSKITDEMGGLTELLKKQEENTSFDTVAGNVLVKTESLAEFVVRIKNKIFNSDDISVLRSAWMETESVLGDYITSVRSALSSFAGSIGPAEVSTVSFDNTERVRLLDLEKEKAGLEGARDWAEKEKQDLEKRLGEIALLLSTSTQSSSEELVSVRQNLKILAEKKSKLSLQIGERITQDGNLRKFLTDVEKTLADLQANLNLLQENKTAVLVERAKSETLELQLRDEVVLTLGNDFWEKLTSGEVVFESEATGEEDLIFLQKKVTQLERQMEAIGEVDELTLREHKEAEEEYVSLSTQVEDLRKGQRDLREAILELDERIERSFAEAFFAIKEKFSEYFKLLFGGGTAELTLLYDTPQVSDSEVVSSLPTRKTIAGIEIRATPPGKKLSGIQSLSGGERAMTSIALLCSMMACFPAPVVVLDEVDAALDEANTVRLGQILSSLSNKTQFIAVTHNRETMSKADVLYGITMGEDGVSRVLSIKLDQAQGYAK